MDDRPVLYVGTVPVPDFDNLGWRVAVEMVFAERDLRAVRGARLTPSVRQVWRRRHRAPPTEFVYLSSSPDDVRARLSIHGTPQITAGRLGTVRERNLSTVGKQQLQGGQDRSAVDLQELE